MSARRPFMSHRGRETHWLTRFGRRARKKVPKQGSRTLRYEFLEERRVLNGDGELFAQRLELTPSNPWQNPSVRLDVNADDEVSPIDGLVQINWLNARGPELLADVDTSPDDPHPYLDTNNDDWVTALDVLVVFNWLNGQLPLAGNDGFLMIKNASDMTLNVMDNDVLPFSDVSGFHIDSVSSSSTESSISILGGNRLLYSPPPDFFGVDTFTYSIARDGLEPVFGSITVTVTAENSAPLSIGPLPPVTVTEDASSQSINVRQLFTDSDAPLGDRLSYFVHNGNTELLTAELNGSQLTLTYHTDASGSAAIFVTATDLAGAEETVSFPVFVAPANDAPTDITLLTNSVPENSPIDTVIGQLSVVDPDASDTATFALVAGPGDDDNGAFTIDGQDLKTAATFDFETKSAYQIRVQATDAGGLSFEQTLVIQVSNENEAPTDITLTGTSISEHATIGTAVGQLSMVDPDAGDTANFTLVAGSGDDDNAAFTIDGQDLKTSVPLDFETQSTYQIRVRATDAGGMSVEQTFVIEILDETNEAPTDVTLSSNTVIENSAVDTIVGQLTAVDPNVGDTATFTLVAGTGDEGNAAFTIAGDELRTALDVDFETQATYQIRVRATDSGGLSVERTLVVQVSNVNESPTEITLLTNNVPENSPIDTVVGQLSVVDPDASDTATFALVAGPGDDDNGAFTIDGQDLKTAATFDFETKSTYQIRVQATDAGGLSFEQTLVIQVSNENEAPTDITLAGASISEHATIGTAVGQLSMVDPDAGDTANFTLVAGSGDDDNAAFTIDGQDLKTSVPLDFETQSTYQIRVRATDAGGMSVEQTFVIEILDETNEAPTDVTLSSNTVIENSAVGTVVGLLTAVDPNVGDTATFTLVAGTGDEDNAAFTIAGDELTTALDLDFESQTTYQIRVRATDAGGLNVERTLVVQVTNENEAPTDITLLTNSVQENSPIDTVIGQLSMVDPDASDTATFTLVAGPGDDDNGAFTIDGQDLKTAASFDFETQSVYQIRVQVTDAGGLSFEVSMQISVSNFNEAPVNQIPGAQTTNTNQPLSFSSAGGNAIQVSDVDAGVDSIHVRLVAQHGTVDVDEFFGSVDEVNALLDGVIFTPDTDFQGDALLDVITDDLGHNGFGGALTDTDQITIVVN